LDIDNPHAPWFCNAVGALRALVRIRPHAAQLVENDDQNAPPAEKPGERLTGVPASPRRAAGFMKSALSGLDGEQAEQGFS
jgi:hypothetical protein